MRSTSFCRGALSLLLLAAFSCPVLAQIQVTDLGEGVDAQDLAEAMVDGVTVTVVPDSAQIFQTAIPGHVYASGPDIVSGNPEKAAGIFSTGAVSPFGAAFTGGLILGSGHADLIEGFPDGNVPPVYNTSTGKSADLGLTGDAQLDLVFANEPSKDATALVFEFVPDSSFITFEFVFASEEYTEYVDDGFNDIFAFFVNGQNVNHAVVGPGNEPVSVDSINPQPNANPQLYVDNESPPVPQRTESDGYTTVLTSYAPVNAGVANTLKLVIADRGDWILDSWVLVRAGSMTTKRPLLLSKVPDAALSQTGAINGYTITVSNPGGSAATLTKLVDYLPQGFSYRSGTTGGFTTANPAISTSPGGRSVLTWTGSWNVPANGSISLNFDVNVSSTPGLYTNSVDGDGSVPVIPSGEVAPVMVRLPVDIGVTGPTGQDLVDDGGTVDLGEWPAGSVRQPVTFTIRNDGLNNLTGLAVSITGSHPSEFVVDTTGMATSLASGGTTTFKVSFKPSTTGWRTAELRIASNDPNENPFNIDVGGAGSSGLALRGSNYLKASNTDSHDHFGMEVAMSGYLMAAGAPEEDSNATGVDAPLTGGSGTQADNSAANAGAVYTYHRDPETDQVFPGAYIKASNTGAGDYFGYSLDIHGDTMVVGAPMEDSNATGVNAALTGGSGTQEDNSAVDSGAAYVFVRDPQTGIWSQQAYLKASNTGAGDWFGVSVSVHGDTILVGAIYEDSVATGVNGDQSDNSSASAGATYVFTRSGGTWSQQAYLKRGPGVSSLGVGLAVACEGDTAVVGGSRRVGVYVRSGSTWTYQATLEASNHTDSDSFGYDLDLSGDTIVVSATHEDSNANTVNGNESDNSLQDSGAAYIFQRTAGVWTQQAYLKADNPGQLDYFGHRVAISGEMVVVAAISEDSDATGFNGDGTNNNAELTGAAYVFIRRGTSWTQEGYAKGFNNTPGSMMYGVSAEGPRIFFGLWGERSSSTGVEGNPWDTSTPGAGAAYIYKLQY